MTSRAEVIARLRPTTPTGMPLLTEGAALIASYLRAERELGRIAADGDVDTLALTLVGTGHLMFAGGPPPNSDAIRKVVTTTVAATCPCSSPS